MNTFPGPKGAAALDRLKRFYRHPVEPARAEGTVRKDECN
jgi:hypothetical protein